MDDHRAPSDKSDRIADSQRKRLLELLDEGLDSLENGRVVTDEELARRLDELFARHNAGAVKRRTAE